MLPSTDVARGSGYELVAGNPVNTSVNLQQRIAVVAEMNHANQATSTTPIQVTSRAQAAALYGWGSPIDMALRILLPQSGSGGASTCPVWVYPVAEAVGALANIQTITITGTATAANSIQVLVSGRSFLEGGSYNVAIPFGAAAADVAVAIRNAINAVVGCPYAATSALGVVTLTARWKGLSSADLNLVITGLNPAGLSYVIANPTPGTGAPTNIPTVLAQFANDWNTIVVTGWSLTASHAASIDAQYLTFNGNPDAQTGQWNPLVMRPAQYFIGNCIDSTTTSQDTALTASLNAENSFPGCPTPNSLGMPIEGAANYAVLAANVFNTTPNIDIEAMVLPDMPGIGPNGSAPSQSSSYTLRNALVLLGMSTVIYNNGQYYPQDFITTYAPTGIPNPTWRYSRDVNIDMNVEYKFSNIRKSVIGNKQIAADNDAVNVANVVKPKDVKAALYSFADDLVAQGLITDAAGMKASVTVVINSGNRNRFDISYAYTRSGVTRVVSTVATVNP